ncbi:complex I subunit 1 family protein, partial [Ferruginibacter sp.]|uniref:complex I subunit 1 family protein n=1 Tax=Ferruginibacter sp. TaxID=1940288 RepID=UPI0026589A63
MGRWGNFMLSFSSISKFIDTWLRGIFNPTWTMVIEMLIAGICVISLFAILGLVLVLMERRVAAWIQIRLGPNRVGPGGMLQSLADTVKLLVKEGMTPDGADKFLFNLAPIIAIIVSMLLMAPIAFAKDFQLWDMNIGVLYVSAISSVMVISILMAGW